MKTQKTKIYLFFTIALVLFCACKKDDSIDKIENQITFEIESNQIVFNNGYFWSGNSFVADSKCNFEKCLYDHSYVQHEGNNGSDFFYLSFNDSLVGTYTFNSVNSQLKAFRVVINGIEYRAYSYTEGSADFRVEITEFGAVGELIKGTFSGTARLVENDSNMGETLITKGEFAIKRKEI